MILGNPTFAGTIMAFFMDNTVPGNDSFDKVMAMILGNHTFAGTILAFFLDNTVPGK